MTFRNIASQMIAVVTQRGGKAGSNLEPSVQPKTSSSYNKSFVLVLVLAFGSSLWACGGSEEAPKDSGPVKSSGATASKSASTNPWGGFKVGSFVKTKTTVSAQMMGRSTDTTTEMKTTLAELTADKAVLDIETTVMGNTTKTRTEIPLTGAVKTGATAGGQTQNPTTGTDNVVVAGKSLACKTIEVETDSAGSKVKTKTWTSDEIPGFMVKSVSTTSGAMNSTTTIEAVDFKAN